MTTKSCVPRVAPVRKVLGALLGFGAGGGWGEFRRQAGVERGAHAHRIVNPQEAGLQPKGSIGSEPAIIADQGHLRGTGLVTVLALRPARAGGESKFSASGEFGARGVPAVYGDVGPAQRLGTDDGAWLTKLERARRSPKRRGAKEKSDADKEENQPEEDQHGPPPVPATWGTAEMVVLAGSTECCDG